MSLYRCSDYQKPGTFTARFNLDTPEPESQTGGLWCKEGAKNCGQGGKALELTLAEALEHEDFVIRGAIERYIREYDY